MAQSLIAEVPGLTALVVTMNMPTQGALEALRSGQIAIPDGLSFIGFDTDDETHHLPDPFAAIRYPAIRLGRAAADLLVQRLKLGSGRPALNTQMGADLFLGSSTAPPRTIEP
jgi:DNA-binding LacI/PurR family transcriptional regulator